MKLRSLVLVAALCSSALVTANDMSAVPNYVTAAIADSNRPAADKDQDANRKPDAILTFAGIAPGEKVVDLMPGGGYYTRLFSKVVGPNGHVLALQPTEMEKVEPELKDLQGIAASPAYANVSVDVQPITAVTLKEPVDVVWTSMNYHDLHDPFMGSPDVAHFNKSIYAQLKPGGLFVVLDHVATSGSGLANTNDLHRIDPETVKAEVLAAGFEFVGESPVLRNPADDHTLKVFDKSIRGKTDKFIYKFRKPLN
jgi:predicted methyltransferase